MFVGQGHYYHSGEGGQQSQEERVWCRKWRLVAHGDETRLLILSLFLLPRLKHTLYTLKYASSSRLTVYSF